MRDERRYYGLDALRGVMMLLGIVLHSAMFYIVQPSEVVPLKDPRTSPLFDLLILFIHSFRMPLFFLLSGFFAALLVERYGMARAFKNRVERVLVPYVIGLATLLPATGYMMLSFGVSTELGGKVLFSPRNPAHLEWMSRFMAKVGGGGPGHLWFLYYLMMLYLLLPLCAAAERLIERRGLAALPRLAGSAWWPAPLVLLTAAALWPYKGGVVEGFQFFRPHVPSLVYYGLFFVAGHLLHGAKEFLVSSQRQLRVAAIAVLPLFLLSVGPTGLDYLQRGADPWLHLAACVLNSLLTWTLIVVSIGLFQRTLDRDSPWVAYISQSSYWVYLVHLPIVSVAAWWLVDKDAPALVKFLLAGTFTTVVAFTSYHYLARRTWISVLLNGRRFSGRWPWLEREAAAGPEGKAAALVP